MNEKEVAYVEDFINELSEMIDETYKKIIDGKKYDIPNFEEAIQKRTLTIQQVEVITEVFTEPFAELHRIEEDDELALKYSWLSEDKRKKLIEVLDALVSSLISEYTEQQPEFQELKENFRKIAENEKEEAQQEKQ
jgi:translation elongation factor EF-G